MTQPFATLRDALLAAAGTVAPCGFSRMRQTRGGRPPDKKRGVLVRRAMRAAGYPATSPTGVSLLNWALHGEEDFSVEQGVRAALSDVLEQAGLLEPPTKLKFGRRVHRLGDGYLVTLIVDPNPNDPTIIYGSRKGVIGRALDAGAVVEAVRCTPKKPEDDVRRRAHTMINTGASMAEVDAHLAKSLGVTPRTARMYRQKWGLTAKPGRPPGRRAP